MKNEEFTMTEIQDTFQTKELKEQHEKMGSEPSWMLSKRMRAGIIFNEMQNVKKERINFPAIDVEKFIQAETIKHSQEHFPFHDENRSGIIVSVNKEIQKYNISNELISSGVIITDFKTALQQHSALLEKYFTNEGVQINDGKFVAQHSALVDSGLFVYVPKNVNVALPFHSYYFLNQLQAVMFPHLIIVVEAGSSLTLLESFWSPEITNANESFVSGVTELFIGDGARLNYVSLQEFGENVLYRNFKRAMMKKDSALTWIEVILGGKQSHYDAQVYLEESGANAEIVGVYFAENKQKMGFDTLQKHIAPHCNSNLHFKGVLTDTAQTSFQGLIRVHKGAQKTDAYQKNQNILLSNGARADSLPELEIEADDVRCTHGATVGPIRNEDLFYLMSRGLSKKEAMRLLTLGFFSEVVDKISVEDVRNEVMNFIEKRLEHVE